MTDLSPQDVQQFTSAAFLFSQAIAAQAEIAGMSAENLLREQQGLSPAYGDEAFAELITRYGLGHNEALTTLASGI